MTRGVETETETGKITAVTADARDRHIVADENTRRTVTPRVATTAHENAKIAMEDKAVMEIEAGIVIGGGMTVGRRGGTHGETTSTGLEGTVETSSRVARREAVETVTLEKATGMNLQCRRGKTTTERSQKRGSPHLILQTWSLFWVGSGGSHNGTSNHRATKM